MPALNSDKTTSNQDPWHHPRIGAGDGEGAVVDAAGGVLRYRNLSC